ncbi:MAG: GNAT family N-acetyltransferase [Promicromonosporaceae bacterium]|nr:GNAT family N-acetyltransferase [Promicromonosporaceae bacterium]
MPIHIVSLRDHPSLADAAVDYLAASWGGREIYRDCITAMLSTTSQLPQWYLALDGESIVGTVGLIANDFNARQDLWPWVCAVHVAEARRHEGIGGRLLTAARRAAGSLGYDNVYLTTNAEGLYERHGFTYQGVAQDLDGECRLYSAPAI